MRAGWGGFEFRMVLHAQIKRMAEGSTRFDKTFVRRYCRRYKAPRFPTVNRMYC